MPDTESAAPRPETAPLTMTPAEWLGALAHAWDLCVDHICSPEESGTANRLRFKRANPYRITPTAEKGRADGPR